MRSERRVLASSNTASSLTRLPETRAPVRAARAAGDALDEVRRRKWLEQDAVPSTFQSVAGRARENRAGAEQEAVGEARHDARNLRVERRSAEAGHAAIANHDVEVRVLLQELERGFAAGTRHDIVVALDERREHAPDRRFVVHDQHARTAAVPGCHGGHAQDRRGTGVCHCQRVRTGNDTVKRVAFAVDARTRSRRHETARSRGPSTSRGPCPAHAAWW